jgi:hypothetical protein
MKHRIQFTLLCFFFINLAFGQTGKIQESTLNKELVAILDTIYLEDQNYRLKSEDLEKKYGWDSKEVKDLWKIINVKDANMGCITWRLPAGFGGGFLRNRSCRPTRTRSEIHHDATPQDR